MKSVLVGNGLDIQFGGSAYTNEYIIQRIICKMNLGLYYPLYKENSSYEQSSLIKIFNGLFGFANKLLKDEIKIDIDENRLYNLNNLKNRYKNKKITINNLMLEDWFLFISIYCFIYKDTSEISMKQNFNAFFLDSILNQGKIQQLYEKMPRSLKNYFTSFDSIFTLNYDNNLEHLTNKTVYHLHGAFDIPYDTENIQNVRGDISKSENKIMTVPGFEHCFCNVLLDNEGRNKYFAAKNSENIIENLELMAKEGKLLDFLNYSKNKTTDDAIKIIETKIEHPELRMANDYHFKDFENIVDEIYIIGISPYNDEHIFNIIENNKNLNKVIYYYYSEEEKKYIEENFSNKFECREVQKLWTELNCKKPKYNCVYDSYILNFLNNIRKLVGENGLKKIYINQELSLLKTRLKNTPQFELKRLNEEVLKIDQSRESKYIEYEFLAAQEGYPVIVLYFAVFYFNDMSKEKSPT
ncbi:MAG TPA: hypothetical protein P5087_01790 [Eubacteriales bacterium]|nr:hypothetical protein [Eubacteriales bacterium]